MTMLADKQFQFQTSRNVYFCCKYFVYFRRTTVKSHIFEISEKQFNLKHLQGKKQEKNMRKA